MACRRERLLPPYPAPKTEPEIEPQFEAEVRMFLAQNSEPGAAADRRIVPGVLILLRHSFCTTDF